MDHFWGFFLGSRILLSLGSGTGWPADEDEDEESGEMGVAVEVTER